MCVSESRVNDSPVIRDKEDEGVIADSSFTQSREYLADAPVQLIEGVPKLESD